MMVDFEHHEPSNMKCNNEPIRRDKKKGAHKSTYLRRKANVRMRDEQLSQQRTQKLQTQQQMVQTEELDSVSSTRAKVYEVVAPAPLTPSSPPSLEDEFKEWEQVEMNGADFGDKVTVLNWVRNWFI